MSVPRTLYQWYVAYFQRSDHETASSGIRDRLGYANTALVPQQMTFEEFIDGLRNPWRTLGVKQSWINRFLAGHEQETNCFSKDVQAFLKNCGQPVPPEFTDRSGLNLKPPYFSRSVQLRDSAEHE
ncbi:MAG: hypothetical protein WKF77_25785 [Planctomycetaceae bacterium]